MQPHKINAKMAKLVKEKVKIPVAVVGGIMTPEEAEEILEDGCADAVVIGRQLIADPWWVKKAWGRPIGRYCSVYQMHELL